ncbi:uncharacterized protein TRAVEDRAFT_29840 [Trametes versicolor FP-101664 SS1]|uniref:uncharacterized protein n=1 Tax=Trametes versicolor (strain FP-101664) TaxID=717944 RepID=UPI0004623D9F|nr:uncharacterized protein TRAVEDRAFT_29840 [Trametes versicolor FP-101664 SS1]EIW57966.1 hypothetical protein TRAVEDRAFT_29840 [Trametes versicolor FP-101664 SS1]
MHHPNSGDISGLWNPHRASLHGAVECAAHVPSVSVYIHSRETRFLREWEIVEDPPRRPDSPQPTPPSSRPTRASKPRTVRRLLPFQLPARRRRMRASTSFAIGSSLRPVGPLSRDE